MKNLRYKCLILDHDDTAVNSTEQIHYPAFIKTLKDLRPENKVLTLNDFIKYNHHPGFNALCKDVLKLSKDEQAYQDQIWKQYSQKTIPDFYDLFVETITKFKDLGGIITVVSHSTDKIIMRDYKHHCGFIPDAIFSWDYPEHLRKPNAYPVLQILKKFNLKPSEVLVLDDLKPALDMAKRAKVDFGAAGWSHSVPEIIDYMQKHSDYYFKTVKEFSDFIFINK